MLDKLLNDTSFLKDGAKTILKIKGIIEDDRISDKNKLNRIGKVVSSFTNKYNIKKISFNEIYKFSVEKLEGIIDKKKIDMEYKNVMSKLKSLKNLKGKQNEACKGLSLAFSILINADKSGKVRRLVYNKLEELKGKEVSYSYHIDIIGFFLMVLTAMVGMYAISLFPPLIIPAIIVLITGWFIYAIILLIPGIDEEDNRENRKR